MLHFRYLRWIVAAASVTAALALFATVLLSTDDLLYRENGILENFSATCWILSVLIALSATRRSRAPESRLLVVWMGWVAALATLRELDIHIWLNPKHLGDLGVRYRLDWWLSGIGSVSLWLRLGWAAVFAGAIGLLVYPPTRLWRKLLELFRKGDALPGVLLASAIFLFLGFVVDDILRPVQVIGLDKKQLVEETTETVGAMLYCAGMVLVWRRPLDGRAKAASPTV